MEYLNCNCRTVRVEVFNELETREITNVFGIIRGREEPGNIDNGSLFLSWRMPLLIASFESFIAMKVYSEMKLPSGCLDVCPTIFPLYRLK